MKKITTVVTLLVLFISCEINQEAVQIMAKSDFSKAIRVVVPKTNNTPFEFEKKSTAVNLAEYISNVNNVTGIAISEVSFQLKNFTGNTKGIIQSLSVKAADALTLMSITNVNPSQEATKGTVYKITDPTIIKELEKVFLLNNTTSMFSVSGSLLSNEGKMEFDIEVSVKLTATIN
ncbi:hypothetical protein OD91_1567 [Lutibacter sp. Hel_I_33_5]|uniref:hypothetical protein n=1 Tax=Lutibacter sp. Hel_I_33_5 TaxID=1566289 RepID=UPI0011A3F9D2|nr:hypothetical protein [Lutibacter sp. Hel_I_33_5]TVZ56283.1 hypothetical protein OD91_1567 [Lutibacter sp. Hel_I_33_5]